MTDQTIVTRFPPSPTGYLHVGGARTAIFNWAMARRHGGRFVLRHEDTDRARSSVDAARSIIADLQWLGLDWDEGPAPCTAHGDPYADQIGDRGPYCQSQRLEIYHEYIARLLDTDAAYVDPEHEGLVRLRMGDRDITFRDAVRGEITVKASELEDFVIRKTDGFPTYHLAVVVDDALMSVNYIIRGQDHLSNTAKHWAIQEALGFEHPTYAHMSLTINPDGSKMGKRDKAKVARAAAKDWLEDEHHDLPALLKLMGAAGEALAAQPGENPLQAFLDKQTDDVSTANAIARALDVSLPEIDVCDFRRSGYLPEVMVNYLGLLGWNPGGDVERFGPDPLGFLREHFDPKRLIKGNASFDRQKLLRFNGEAIAELPPEEFQRRLCEQFQRNDAAFAELCRDERRFALFAEAYHKRSQTLEDPAAMGRFFVMGDDEIEYAEKAVKKVLAKGEGAGYAVLEEIRPRLAAVDPWRGEALEGVVRQFAESNETGMGKVAQPIRVAVTGDTVSPPLGVTLEILGRDATLARIDRCLSQRVTA